MVAEAEAAVQAHSSGHALPREKQLGGAADRDARALAGPGGVGEGVSLRQTPLAEAAECAAAFRS